MAEKTIAMSLSGVLISSKAWKQEHETGMKELAEKSGIFEIAEKTDDENYFQYVEKALEKIYPDLNREERIAKRRRIYFSRVIKMIKNHHEYIKEDIIKFFKSIKHKYNLILITTTIDDVVSEVLDIIKARDLFDFVSASKDIENDDKSIVFQRAIDKYNIDRFIGSSKSREICEKHDIEFLKFDCDADSLNVLKNAIDF